MKKWCVFLTLFCFLTGCGVTSSDIQYEALDQPYVVTDCIDHQATTEIAVKDGKVYCAYLETDQNNSEQYVIDVFEDDEWRRVETVTGSLYDHPLFSSPISYNPLNEKIGKYTLYSSEDHALYLAPSNGNVHYDLGWGFDWRRVATDHENTFAVLSAQMFSVDGDYKAELRIYTVK